MPGLCRFLAVSAACAVLASPVFAQGASTSSVDEPSQATTQPVTQATAQDAPLDTPVQTVATGPTFQNATSGIRANTAHEDLTAAEAAHRAAAGSGGGGLNKGAIILVVGGAAIAAGVLIGGTGGAALAIGGALVALYGIYLLLQ
jgi:hypothetical protein